MGTLYMLVNTINGKKYIGQTKQTLNDRMSVHKRKHSGCRALKAAITKYGWEAFRVEVLEANVPEASLRDRERELIAEHGTMAPNGYNLTPGGEITPMIFPSVVARRRETMAKPEMVQRVKDVYAKPEVKEAMSKGIKATWAGYTPEQKAERVAKNTKACRDSGAGEKRAKHCRDNPVFMATQKAAQNRPEVTEKRKATWAAKREAKLALLPPEVAARKRVQAARRAEYYAANKDDYNAKIRERRVKQRTSRSPPSAACATEKGYPSWMIPSDSDD